jgi:hypothetical protein
MRRADGMPRRTRRREGREAVLFASGIRNHRLRDLRPSEPTLDQADGGEDGAPRLARKRLLVDMSFRRLSTRRGWPSNAEQGPRRRGARWPSGCLVTQWLPRAAAP